MENLFIICCQCTLRIKNIKYVKKQIEKIKQTNLFTENQKKIYIKLAEDRIKEIDDKILISKIEISVS